ncbi:DEAD/DEAH box helicase, partial [Penicillium sp. IBT 35674x]
YYQTGSRVVDLVGDFVGPEIFIIDGDSLLLECFSNEKLDFYPGFQVLHATYLVERFLQRLKQRRCVFEIVFFAENAEFCIPSGVGDALHNRYLLAREAIVQHLISFSHKTQGLRVRKLESFRSAQFEAHLVNLGSYLFMCHDGAFAEKEDDNTSSDSDSDSENEIDHEELEGNKAEVFIQRTTSRAGLRRMIHWFITHGCNVSLINSLEFRDTKVMSMVIEGVFRHKREAPLQKKTLFTNTLIPEIASQEMDVPEPNNPDNSIFSGDSSLGGLKTILEQVIHEQPSLTQRQCLVIVSLVAMYQEFEFSFEHKGEAAAMILHLILLQGTQLEDRAVQVLECQSSPFFSTFLQVAKGVLSSTHWEMSTKTHQLPCDLADLCDGRLFAEVNRMIKRHGIDNIISLATLLPYNDLVSLLNRLCGAGLRLAVIKESKQSILKPIKGKGAKGKQQGFQTDTRFSVAPTAVHATVLPFRNEVFDKQLAPVYIEVDDSMGAEDDLKASKNFMEQTHWHNSKPLDSKKAPKLAAKDQSRYQKRNQFYMAEMKQYAESLLGSAGMSQPDIVIAGPPANTKGKPPQEPDAVMLRPPITKEKPQPSPVRAHPGNGRGKLSVREMAAASIQQKAADEERKERLKWKSKLEAMALGPNDPISRFYIMEKYLSTLSKKTRGLLEAEVLAYLLDASYQAITGEDNCKGGSITLTHIWGLISRLMKLRHGNNVEISEFVRQVCHCLELPAVSLPVQTSQPLSFKLSKITRDSKNTIEMSGVDFQLMHGGPFMERGIGSLPDPRTPDFEPDLWQREVLDQIDAKKSAFIVAPTSAGKTFISFYAMKQVLQEDNDGILVYVAPTKALVNQIAAEVQARFRKSYPAKATGKSVWAIHTRDHRINNPNGCQILITVPHILQIMLLSPTNAQAWTPRLKRIIFDEIHCIGQAQDGVVWEQLLLLAPCPIIALSATVGNPDEFYSWLKYAQGVNGHDLKMISHKHRYSDLRNYEYCPPRSFSFRGFLTPGGLYQLGLDEADDMKFMHPVLSLVDRSRGIPNDFSLEPRDCLTLWKALHHLQTEDFPVDASLSPSAFFSDAIIGKKDVIEWQRPLLELVSDWMKDRDSPFDALLLCLGESDTGSDATADTADAPSTSPRLAVSQDDELLSTTLPLICSLQAQCALPALFFNYDRSRCEDICKHLLTQLREAESAWKSENPAWKTKVKKWSEWKRLQEEVKKKTTKSTKKKRSEDQAISRADEVRDAASSEGSLWELFDPERPVERFSLADPRKLAQSEFLKYTEELKWRDTPRWLIDALERGIGVHHAGMNRKYRQVCEILFRRGFLRVVIATGTLALGINMPCKTVVFSGDSLFLTSLNFRQASGRAGRRGFDLLGNVVFQNVPTAKIHRLVSSRLPDLNGHFPITASLVLRLFILLHGSGKAPSAVKSINSLLSSPRICLGGPEMKHTVLHYLRFSIEYLRRNQLINSIGAPLNFAGFISHLYYTESSSFAFHALLDAGYFHSVCKHISEKSKSSLQTLMLVMCHVFKRVPLRQSTIESYRTADKRGSSVVILPGLPKTAAKVLANHNRRVRDIYTGYVSTFIDQHVGARDYYLPLSGAKCGGQKSAMELGVIDTPLSTAKITSPFYALSGHGDQWDTVADLCETVRDGVWLEESVVPYVPIASKRSPLNAYLYDFFKHGNVHELERANGVRRSDIWYELNDFSMILATITASLGNIVNPHGNSDIDMLDVAGDGDVHEILADDGKIDHDDSQTKNGTPMTPAGKLQQKPAVAPTPVLKTSLKSASELLDSWEDEIDNEVEKVSVEQDSKLKLPQRQKEERKKEKEEKTDQAGQKRHDQQSLLLVYNGFSLLKHEFDTKFKEMWA